MLRRAAGRIAARGTRCSRRDARGPALEAVQTQMAAMGAQVEAVETKATQALVLEEAAYVFCDARRGWRLPCLCMAHGGLEVDTRCGRASGPYAPRSDVRPTARFHIPRDLSETARWPFASIRL